MKGLDEIIALVQRHAPALIVHLLLFLWLTLVVLDPATLPDGGATWTRIAAGIDGSLKAVGLSLQRWYVLAAVLIAYFTLFEWMRNVVATLPLARIGSRRERASPDLFAYAGAALRLPPNHLEVRKALNQQIKQAVERVRQAGERHPYQTLLDRQAAWTRYHGTLMVVLAAIVAWGVAGAPYARSPARVWWTAALLLALCLGIRVVVRRLRSQELVATSYWALGERSDLAAPAADPLYLERQRAARRAAEVERLLDRHPSGLVGRLALSLPRRWRDRVFARLEVPRVRADDREWRLVTARHARRADETVTPPAALRVDAHLDRFAALLECPGAGLCVLVPSGTGAAPAAVMGGEAYSLTERRHGTADFAVRLFAPAGLDLASRPRLCADTWGSTGFIAILGDHPIELLAGGIYSMHGAWSGATLGYGPVNAAGWAKLAADGTTTVDGVVLAQDAPLTIGTSYLLGVRTEAGTEARAVAQCFRIEGEEKLLVAWRVMEAPGGSRDTPLPAVAPWWRLAGWRGLWRPAPADTPAAQ